MRTSLTLLATFSVGAMASATAHAEGSPELPGPSLSRETTLSVDIIDSYNETIWWVGEGRATVTDPDGTVVGTLSAAEFVPATPGIDGTYVIKLDTEQSHSWEVLVMDDAGTIQDGRLFSQEWFFNSETYAADNALDASVYVLVPTGSDDETSVIKMDMSGVVGWQWSLGVNGDGAEGANGRSVPTRYYDFTSEYRIYVNPPEVATYQVVDPLTGELTVTFPGTDCDGFIPGQVEGAFHFTASAEGSYHVTCDLNGDGAFDPTSDDDLTLSGHSVEGENVVPWDGTDNGGDPVAPGTYQCRAMTTVGEIHHVADDIETAYPGVRMFKYLQSGAALAVPMYWNDLEVQDAAVTMPDGQISAPTSGPDGVSSGDVSDAFEPNLNAHAWGNFTEDSKGNISFIDTHTWLAENASGEISITVINPDEDDCWDDSPEDTSPPEEDTGEPEDTATPDQQPPDPTGYYHGGRLCSVSPAAGGWAALIGLLAVLGLRRED